MASDGLRELVILSGHALLPSPPADTFSGGLDANGRPLNPPGGGGGRSAQGPPKGGRGGGMGGRGSDMKRFKPGPRGGGKSLDARAAATAAAGPQAPPREAYMKQLNDELS